ncbi:MAG: hypothetical protein ACJ76F_03015 [Bacteroidia bacterium]
MKKIFLLFSVISACNVIAQVKDNVPFMEYTYQNGSCNGFKYGTGSLIFIPDNAFCMMDGSACKGTIKVKYREYHSQIDMLVAKLNMFLDKNGKRSMLESAGMFEIAAECNGKPMQLCDGKSIQVRMNCRRNLPDLNAYIYDRKKNLWTEADTKVYDFSYQRDNNNRNNSALWGSPATSGISGDSVMESGVDPEGMEVVRVVTTAVLQLPEGFFKGMNIKSLGIYNYDRVIKEENAIPMIPEFVLSTGEKLNQVVYVAYESTNSLIYYSPDDFAERFVLLNLKGIRMFTMFKDGSVACINQDVIDKMNLENLRGKKFTFTLEKQPKKPVSKEELAKATKLKQQ